LLDQTDQKILLNKLVLCLQKKLVIQVDWDQRREQTE
jgi:hypothetical protein